MGITGLLTLLRSVQKPVHISSLRGECVGVDAYVWLHRGAIACATELCTAQPTKKYVDYCMHRVKMLLHFGVVPYIVFDGGHLPMKAMTESSRRSKREENRAKGLELLRAGRKSEAFEYFQKAIDVTPAMAFDFIMALRKLNVQYVVAPYEADAQLAYLEKQGFISAVITEDSDLLVFGCQRIIFKLDKFGEGTQLQRADLSSNSDISFIGWTDALFRQMCILSGCDYLPSINGFGLKKAHRYLSKYKDITKLIRAARMDGFNVLPDYEEMFKKAEITFLHQRVFCPRRQQLVHLTPLYESQFTCDIDALAGSGVQDDIAIQIAQGLLDPISRKVLGTFSEPAISEISFSRRTQSAPRLTPQLHTQPIKQFFDRANIPSNSKSIPSSNKTTSHSVTETSDLYSPLKRSFSLNDTDPDLEPFSLNDGKRSKQAFRRVVSHYFVKSTCSTSSTSITTAKSSLDNLPSEQLSDRAHIDPEEPNLLPLLLTTLPSQTLTASLPIINENSTALLQDEGTFSSSATSEQLETDGTSQTQTCDTFSPVDQSVAQNPKNYIPISSISATITTTVSENRRLLTNRGAIKQNSKDVTDKENHAPTSNMMNNKPTPKLSLKSHSSQPTNSTYFPNATSRWSLEQSERPSCKTLGMGSSRSLKKSQSTQQVTIAAYLERHWNKPLNGW